MSLRVSRFDLHPGLDTGPRRAPTLADAATYARLFEHWSGAGHRETVPTYQLGYVKPRRRARRRPPLPLLQLLVQPGESIDFAGPQTGFHGLGHAPPPDRVLTVWADDLLSVRHGDAWMYVVDSDRPLPRAWLDLVAATGAGRPGRAVLTAAFAGPTPSGEFRLADLDASTYTTLVHLEDRRRHRTRRSRAGAATGG